MDKSEAEEYRGRRIRLILSNNFHYSGEVIDITSTSLIITDKFGVRVSINLADIMVCSKDGEEQWHSTYL